jgi:hypothetical protein
MCIKKPTCADVTSVYKTKIKTSTSSKDLNLISKKNKHRHNSRFSSKQPSMNIKQHHQNAQQVMNNMAVSQDAKKHIY